MHLGAHVPVTGGLFNAPASGALDKLRAIHLNDSKREKGSRFDRHARADAHRARRPAARRSRARP
jgi:hypothetical protein